MLNAILFSLAVATVLPDGPVAWSPDGRWVAYAAASGPTPSRVETGWFLGDGPISPTEPADALRRWDVWVVEPATGSALRVEHGAVAVTAPCWRPDGGALAFGRVPADAPSRFEIVTLDNPDRPKVIHRNESSQSHALLRERVQGRLIAWGPDGRLLAVPGIDRDGLWLMRADAGTEVLFLEHARAPSFAPDGRRLAVLTDVGLAWVDVLQGELKPLVTLKQVERLPPPSWAPDGRSIRAVQRLSGRLMLPGRPPGTELADLVQVKLDGGPPERIWSLVHDPLNDPEAFQGASVAIAADGNQLYYAVRSTVGRPRIAVANPREGAVRTQFNPVDESIGLDEITVSGDRDRPRLALRVMRPDGAPALAAVCDPITQELTPLVPDETSRLAWVDLLLETTRDVLNEQPARGPDGRLLERATLLPGPSEFGGPLLATNRLGHLARIGKRLCGPEERDAASSRIDLSRLVFAYLDHDPERPAASFEAAAVAFESAARHLDRPDDRLRMIALEAQIEQGRGGVDHARTLLDYLKDVTPKTIERVEETPLGPRSVTTPTSLSAWIDHLNRSAVAETQEGEVLDTDDRSMGNINFDAPRPGLGLDPPPPPADPGRVDDVRGPGR
jgi:Tol biopolymer transport system component